MDTFIQSKIALRVQGEKKRGQKSRAPHQQTSRGLATTLHAYGAEKFNVYNASACLSNSNNWIMLIENFMRDLHLR